MSIYSDFIAEDTKQQVTPTTTSPYSDFIKADVEEKKKKESIGQYIWRGLKAIPEEVASIVMPTASGLASGQAGLAGALGSLVTSPQRAAWPGGGKPVQEAEKTMQKISEVGTYKPTTPVGQFVTNVTNVPMTATNYATEKIAGLFPNSPEAQAAIRMGGNLGLNALILKGGTAFLKARLPKETQINKKLYEPLEKTKATEPVKPTVKQPWEMTDQEFKEGGWADFAKDESTPILLPSEYKSIAKNEGIVTRDLVYELNQKGVQTLDSHKTRTGSIIHLPPESKTNPVVIDMINNRGATVRTEKVGDYLIVPDKFAPKIQPAVKQPYTIPEAWNIEPGEIPGIVSTVESRILQAFKEAKRLNKEQKQIRAKEQSLKFEKAERIGELEPTEAGFYKQEAALGGKQPNLEIETLRTNISQADIESIFQKIEQHPGYDLFDKLSAKEGFENMLEGVIPQAKQISMLEPILGKELTGAILDKRTTLQKMKTMGIEFANLPRAFMSSADLSFGLRQGIVAAARHPIIFAKAFAKQFGMFGSEKVYRAVMDEIMNRPSYKLMMKSKLDLVDIGQSMFSREERFQSPLANKIPILRQSARAYTGFANKLRADIFDHLMKRANDMGLKPYDNLKVSSDIAEVINTITGRGSLGKVEGLGPALNAVFFSPKLMMSRLNLLNPMYYMKLSKFARMEALKSTLAFASAGTTILMAIKLMGGDVGTDITSADFGKIKVGKDGKTRVDIFGGFTQYARLAGQLIAGKVTSSTTGKVTELGKGYKPLNPLDLISRFFEYKEAPVVSFVTGLLRGTGSMGQEFKVDSEVVKRFVPMMLQDIYDISKDDPSLIPVSALGIFGVGLQTYGPKNPKTPMGQELDRLKLDIDWLNKLPNKDKIPKESYQKLSEISRIKIEQVLNQVMATPGWAKATDDQKIKYIKSQAERIKRQMTKPYLGKETEND